MRLLVLFILIFAESSWSYSETRCQLVDGFYKNSSQAITDLKFESLVDFFSVNAAKTLSFKMDGRQFRFDRTDIAVKNQTKMNFIMLGKNTNKAAMVQIDRSPKKALASKSFYGHLIINMPINERAGEESPVSFRPLVYNFYCSF